MTPLVTPKKFTCVQLHNVLGLPSRTLHLTLSYRLEYHFTYYSNWPIYLYVHSGCESGMLWMLLRIQGVCC